MSRSETGSDERERIETMDAQFTEINFGPWFHNILDYIGKPLVTRSGHAVRIERGFKVYIDDKLAYTSDDNISVSAYLNSMQTGTQA
jgi:hypothetical protein